MLMVNQLAGFGAFQGSAPYTTSSVRVSGDRLTPAVSGAPTSAEFIISFWLRDKAAGADRYFIQETGNVSILSAQPAAFRLGWQAITGLSGVAGNHASPGTTNDTWCHYIMSCSVANSRGQMYVDGVANGTFTPSGAGHNWSTVHTWFSHPTNVAQVDAEIAEWYIHCSASLDLSVPSNLEKFRSSAGKPVDLGADGSTPTGSQPHYYHKGGTQAEFIDNKGSLGDAVVSSGALAAGASSPSD